MKYPSGDTYEVRDKLNACRNIYCDRVILLITSIMEWACTPGLMVLSTMAHLITIGASLCHSTVDIMMSHQISIIVHDL